MTTKILRNLLSAAVLTIALAAGAVSPDLPRVEINGVEYYYYDVKKGESIYKVAKLMGVSTGDITRTNPSALDGLRPGMRLYIPVGEEAAPRSENHAPAAAPAPVATPAMEPVTQAPAPKPAETPAPAVNETPAPVVAEAAPEAVDTDAPVTYTHRVKRGESLYGIARAAGMTMNDVVALNPHAAYGVSPGDELTLVKSISDDDTASSAPAAPEVERMEVPQPDYSLIESERNISVPIPVEEYVADTLSMAVLLPFMLESEEPTKQSQLFTEFYEGLLLAAETLGRETGVPHIVIRAYDTAASLDTVNALMADPLVRNANVIIAPDADAEIAAITAQMSPTSYLFNAFNVKSQQYKTYPNVIQANIPHGDLYGEAAEAFMDIYAGCTPVFLGRIDGHADKDAFVSMLKAKLDAAGTGYRDLTFRNLLSTKDLAELPDSLNYVFVPMSGQRSEFAKITEAIKRFAAERPERTTALFGYPEWITFRGEYYNRLGENNATIYTRFYAAPNDPARVELDNRFREAYGTPMLDAAPVQGILGYDSGMYLIKTLRENGGDFHANPGSYFGIQSAFVFPDNDDTGVVRADAPAGIVNHAIFIVTFGPEGYVDKRPLI